jgi:hypothetical protein
LTTRNLNRSTERFAEFVSADAILAHPPDMEELKMTVHKMLSAHTSEL